MAVGALTRLITKSILRATDNIFDEDIVANKIDNTVKNLESSESVNTDSSQIQDYIQQQAGVMATGNKLPNELVELGDSLDPEYTIGASLEEAINYDLNGLTSKYFKSQYTDVDDAPPLDDEADRAIYQYLIQRLNKHNGSNLLTEEGRNKVLTRTIASLKDLEEWKALKDSMPNFEDSTAQAKKMPAPVANREEALSSFLKNSVEKKPVYRGVSSLVDTEWDARFWMTNEIGPHVGTLGQASYFAMKGLMSEGLLADHVGVNAKVMTNRLSGESGKYIPEEQFNVLYDLAVKIDANIEKYLDDMSIDPNEPVSYTKLSIENDRRLSDLDIEDMDNFNKTVQGHYGGKDIAPLRSISNGFEEIVADIAIEELGIETILPTEIKQIAELIAGMRGWGKTTKPATIQKGYVNVENPLYIGNDGVWNVDVLFKPDFEGVLDQQGKGLERIVEAMAYQLDTTPEEITNSQGYKELVQKAAMMVSRGGESVTDVLQFEQQQVEALEVAGFHQEFRKFLESYGFDSIQYKNQIEPSFTGESNYSYVLFKPEQWKSVFATKFDPLDKRVGAADGGLIGFFKQFMADNEEITQDGTRRTIQKGDTLAGIAKETGVSLEELQRYNEIKDPNKIQAGQTLRIAEPVEKNQVLSNIGSFLNPFAGDKTAEDYDTSVVNEIKRAAKSAISAGRMNIDYEDYKGADVRGQASSPERRKEQGFLRRMLTGDISPTEEAAFSVGGATLVVEDGKLYATDVYDFSEIPQEKVKDTYSALRYAAGKFPGREFKSKIYLGDASEFDLRQSKAKGGRVDKDKMACNKPKRTPNHPKKSHVVKACEGGKEKVIRFGEQGAKTAGKPKAGESKRMKAKRKSFKARHRKNIKKGKMSAAYWADKTKW